MTKQLISKMSYMTPSRLGHWNNIPSSSMQAAASQSLSLNKQQYQQSLLKEQSRRRLSYQQPSRNTRTCFSRKPPPNYHLLDHTITSLNSRTCLCPNRPKLTSSYQLDSIEHQAYKEFIEEHFKTGKFSSKFPQAIPFFFVKRRKLGNYFPAKIIGTSIAIPSKTPTSFPLSPTS